MSKWSQKRQTLISGVVILLIILVGLFIFISNRKPESCFDGKLNQDELGIDCGGGCSAVCQTTAEDVAILWARVVPVVDDVYSVVAMVENPNLDFEAQNVPYTFKLYDDRNILIYERKGSTFFPSGETFPIFEHALRTGERIPTRASFELRKAPFWKQADSDDIEIKIVTKNITEEDSSPKLIAVVKNDSFQILSNIKFIALLYNDKDNLINASQTILQRLISGESDTITFTWPINFDDKVARTEIVPVSFVR